MSQLVKKPRMSNYTDAEVTEGLMVLAQNSGNSRRAERELVARGRRVSERTLRRWRRDNEEDYERLKKTHVDHVFNAIAEQNLALALEEGEIVASLNAKVRDSVNEMDGKEAAQASNKLSVNAGIHIDKAAIIHGRPTQITEKPDVHQLMRALANRFGGMVKVEAEEVEVVPARTLAPQTATHKTRAT